MSTNSAKLPWIAGTVIAVLAILGLSWTFLVSPRLDDRDDLNEQADNLRVQNDILAVQVAQLKLEFAKIDDYRDEISALRVYVPDSEKTKEYHQLMSEQLAEAGLGLEEVTYTAASTLDTAPILQAENPRNVQAPAPDTEAQDTGAANGEGGSDESESASAVAAEPPTELEVPEGLVLIPVEITFAGPYQAVLDFLRAQQTNDRIFTVSGIDMNAVLEDVEDPRPGELPLIFGDVEVFLTGYLWAMAPLPSELALAEDDSEPGELGPLPTPGAPNNPLQPIIGGEVGSSSGLPVRTPAAPSGSAPAGSD